MGQGRPYDDRNYAKRVTSGRTASPEQIRANKNARSHQRNLDRQAKKRSEAEARNAEYQALPLEVKKMRNPSKFAKMTV